MTALAEQKAVTVLAEVQPLADNQTVKVFLTDGVDRVQPKKAWWF